MRPEGMSFLVFARRMAKTINKAARSASGSHSKVIIPVAQRLRAAAKAADIMSEMELLAFTKPITPPMTSSTM